MCLCFDDTVLQIAYEILEDILLQGDHMRDTLQQLQDAVYLTKANNLSLFLLLLISLPYAFYTVLIIFKVVIVFHDILL